MQGIFTTIEMDILNQCPPLKGYQDYTDDKGWVDDDQVVVYEESDYKDSDKFVKMTVSTKVDYNQKFEPGLLLKSSDAYKQG